MLENKLTQQVNKIKTYELESGKKILCSCKDYKSIQKATSTLKKAGLYND